MYRFFDPIGLEMLTMYEMVIAPAFTMKPTHASHANTCIARRILSVFDFMIDVL